MTPISEPRLYVLRLCASSGGVSVSGHYGLGVEVTRRDVELLASGVELLEPFDPDDDSGEDERTAVRCETLAAQLRAMAKGMR